MNKDIRIQDFIPNSLLCLVYDETCLMKNC